MPDMRSRKAQFSAFLLNVSPLIALDFEHDRLGASIKPKRMDLKQVNNAAAWAKYMQSGIKIGSGFPDHPIDLAAPSYEGQVSTVVENLKIVVVEADRDLAFQIVDTLKSEGWDDVTVLADASGLARKIATLSPDLVLIDLQNPSRDALEQVSRASDSDARPVAMFVDHSDDEMTLAAMSAGLSAYVVGTPEPERIRSVLKTAVARFQVTSQMRKELELAKQALQDRKTIDRAKGMVMRARNVTEEEAYALMRSTAMSQNRKVIDVANALLTAADLLE